LTRISLPLAIWGEGYGDFLDRWLDGVHGLNRQPDEIVLVTDEQNKGLHNLKTDIPIQTHWLKAQDYRLWDYAIRQSTGDWIAICNVDDVFLPAALDTIDQADREGYNLLIDSLVVKQTGHVWRGYWDAGTIPHRFTMPGAEPMRKDLYLEAGGFDYNFQYPDWALMVKAVAKGIVRPFNSPTERIIFDTGADRLTMSGGQQNPSVKARGSAQVHELAKDLGLL